MGFFVFLKYVGRPALTEGRSFLDLMCRYVSVRGSTIEIVTCEHENLLLVDARFFLFFFAE